MKKTALLVCLFTLVFLCGCWDRRELNEVAFIAVAGIDQAPAEKLRLTGQIVLPRQLLSPSPAGGTSTGGKEKAFILATAEGETALEANRNLIKELGRRVYWDHNRVIIIGERLARQGIAPFLDIFVRTPEARLRTLLVVAKEAEIEELLAAEEKLDPNLAKTLENALHWRRASGKIKDVDLKEFLELMGTEGSDPVASAVTLQDKTLTFAGTAVFKKDKLVGWLSDFETQGFLYAVGKKPGGIITTSFPDGEKVVLELTRAKSKIIPEMKKNKVSFIIRTSAEGRFRETHGSANPTELANWSLLEKEMAAKMEKQIKAAVDKAQGLGADIFGLGEVLHRKDPKAWKTLKENWAEIYPTVEVKVKVTARLREHGVLRAPVVPR